MDGMVQRDLSKMILLKQKWVLNTFSPNQMYTMLWHFSYYLNQTLMCSYQRKKKSSNSLLNKRFYSFLVFTDPIPFSGANIILAHSNCPWFQDASLLLSGWFRCLCTAYSIAVFFHPIFIMICSCVNFHH